MLGRLSDQIGVVVAERGEGFLREIRMAPSRDGLYRVATVAQREFCPIEVDLYCLSEDFAEALSVPRLGRRDFVELLDVSAWVVLEVAQIAVLR